MNGGQGVSLLDLVDAWLDGVRCFQVERSATRWILPRVLTTRIPDAYFACLGLGCVHGDEY